MWRMSLPSGTHAALALFNVPSQRPSERNAYWTPAHVDRCAASGELVGLHRDTTTDRHVHGGLCTLNRRSGRTRAPGSSTRAWVGVVTESTQALRNGKRSTACIPVHLTGGERGVCDNRGTPARWDLRSHPSRECPRSWGPSWSMARAWTIAPERENPSSVLQFDETAKEVLGADHIRAGWQCVDVASAVRQAGQVGSSAIRADHINVGWDGSSRRQEQVHFGRRW